MHQLPTKQKQTLPSHHRHHILPETLAVAELERKQTLVEPRNNRDFNRIAAALEDVGFGLEEESENDVLTARGAYAGGEFPLGITAGGGGDEGMRRPSEVYEGEAGEERGVKSFKLCGGGGDFEGGVDLGNSNPNHCFKFCGKLQHEAEGRRGEYRGVALSVDGEGIKGGGVKPFNQLGREDETGRFSPKIRYYGENEDILHKGCVQVLKRDPANVDGAALSIEYGHEDEGACRGGIKLPDAMDNGDQDCRDGGANFLHGDPDKSITLSEGYEYDAQDQDEEGGGVNLLERREGGNQDYGIGLCKKYQSQSEGQELDDGGVCLSEDQDTEYGGVKLFNGPQSQDEDVRLSPAFDYEEEDEDEVEGGVHILTEDPETRAGVVKLSVEGEYGDSRSGEPEYERHQHAQAQPPTKYEDEDRDEYHDNLKFAQETEDDDGDRRESGATLPQQRKSTNRPEAEGMTFPEDCDAKPSLAYLKLLAHFSV